MLPFRPKPSAEEPNPHDGTAHTVRKQATTVPLCIQNNDLVSLDVEASSVPVVPATEIAPMANYEAPTNALSEATPSSCGETFSTFTAGTLQSRWAGQPPRPLLVFKNFIVYDDAARTLPFEIDEHPEVSGSRPPPSCPLSWQYEFSWRGGAILFAGDPLNTTQARSRSSDLCDATFGDSAERSATLTTHARTYKSADEVTCKSWDSEGLRNAAFKRGQIQKEIEETRAYLLEQLEAYWRSHPPQRSPGRRKGKGPAHQAAQRPSARDVSRPYNKRDFAGGRRRIGQGCGDGDEDDDDGEDDSAPTAASSMPNAQDRWYACPFQKWRPQHYVYECGTGFRRIIDVKNHLLKKHYAITCPRCGSVYDDVDLVRLHLLKGCQNPPRSHPGGCFMSERQRETISAHFGGKKMPDPEKWKFLFRTLFPNEPFPESIYLLPRQQKFRNFLDSWLWSEGKKALDDIRCQALSNPRLSWYEPEESQQAAVIAQFITWLLERASEERLYADSAMARQDFERTLSSNACVSAVATHQASAAPSLTWAHDPVAQLAPGEWNPQQEPNLWWPMPTIGEDTGVSGCLNTDIDSLGPTSTCSNGSSGPGENPIISLNHCDTLVPQNGPAFTFNTDGLGIPGIDLPGPSSVAQWAGGYQQDGLIDLDSSHLTNGAVPASNASGVDGHARPLTAWNPCVQSGNWCLPDDSFNQGFDPWRILNDDMISEVVGHVQE
ncbi:hypothetical protein F5144DRAFT_392965 [Chaetomium tenue]|uniref:Uncharacterized protein n=1 Tax=Chaetomium tenue TaxID=1854479 RepID=A0ACB7NVC1_9PEZI|nr:hypothetical protein F5144DRAFT_392965 [Chaetomium globosum]